MRLLILTASVAALLAGPTYAQTAQEPGMGTSAINRAIAAQEARRNYYADARRVAQERNADTPQRREAAERWAEMANTGECRQAAAQAYRAGELEISRRLVRMCNLPPIVLR
ncbi:MAG: hypothetical protein EON90_04215 [Brevundimonas sp.]|nr:MAG: hypothetical protein EON90_04215 [Brevundimonas sp.]